MDEAVGDETHFGESIGEKEQVDEVSCLNTIWKFWSDVDQATIIIQWVADSSVSVCCWGLSLIDAVERRPFGRHVHVHWQGPRVRGS